MANKVEKIFWSDESIIFIIENVHKTEYIWKASHIGYKNKGKKQLFWMNLVDELNKKFININFEYTEVVKKWNNLKSYFATENNKLIRTKKSGASTSEVEVLEESPNWKYYKKLSFLKENEDPMPSVNTFNKRSLGFLSVSTSPSANMPYTEDSSTNIEGCFLPISPEPQPSTSFAKVRSPSVIKTLSPSLPSPTTYTSQLVQEISTDLSSRSSCTSSPLPPTESVPAHPAKKPRTNKPLPKTPNQQLAEECIETSNGLVNLLKNRTPVSFYADSIAADLNQLDSDLQNLLRHKFNNLMFEFLEMQRKRNEEKEKKK